MIKIDMYPSPIIYDEATTEGAISPGDDSGSSSGSSSSSSSNSAGKKRKLKN